MQPHDRLKRIPLFSDLTSDELADLVRIAKVVSFVPGKHLCTRGERAASAFVIEHGEAEVWGVSDNGKRSVIARVGPGEVVGELSLVDGQPRSADVIAKSEVRGYRIDRADLDALRRELHPIVFKLLRRIAITISDRLRDVNDAIAGELTGGKPAPGRASVPGSRQSVAGAEPGRASRAGARVSRDVVRDSSIATRSKPSAKPSPKEPEPRAPSGSLWSSMVERLSGVSWK